MKIAKPDKVLFGITVILIVLGIIVLASVSANISLEKTGSSTYFLFHQIRVGILPGIILALIAFLLPLKKLKEWAFGILISSLLFMTFVFVPGVGITLGGANRWVNLRFAIFQPSELLKIATFIYLAAWLSNRFKKEEKKHKINWSKELKPSKTLLPFLTILGGIGAFLIIQPDISTLGVIVGISIIMYFLAGGKLFDIFLMVLMGIIGLFALIKIAPYRMNRFLVFLKPELDPMGIGYQMKQALITIGSGGIFGIGLGMSLQKFGLLPQPMADTIFAIYAEETGFLGSVLLISLFILFLWRGFQISRKVKDKFSQLLGFGITSWIVIQASINMGAMMGIFPLTGIPLPFISYGGSHLVAEFIGLGLLLNISKNI